MVGAWEGFAARLVVIPEMAIQGMIANTPGNRAKEKEFAMTIPGPETDELCRKAKQINCLYRRRALHGEGRRFSRPVLQRRVHSQPEGRDHLQALQGHERRLRGRHARQLEPARRMGRVDQEEGQGRCDGGDLSGRQDGDRKHRHLHLPRRRLSGDRSRPRDERRGDHHPAYA